MILLFLLAPAAAPAVATATEGVTRYDPGFFAA
jgi:hypothetical protein